MTKGMGSRALVPTSAWAGRGLLYGCRIAGLLGEAESL